MTRTKLEKKKYNSPSLRSSPDDYVSPHDDNANRSKDWEQKYGQEEQIKSQMHAGRLCSQGRIVIGSLSWNEEVAVKKQFCWLNYSGSMLSVLAITTSKCPPPLVHKHIRCKEEILSLVMNV
jgi:hypothetical protein